ncbi:helix-turn-helix domain-containing protein [Mesorhizobium sp. YC-39]|uniref:helix-turn-helix domain-containing protein n=1 Tax=unclassified Mesorhizobium TaxID=325217 RepID=UPI0021E915E4|nr:MULTISPECIES: helix-turn-helix domain-containing protein [unclassified Mesorhizobium]MCV3209631.1 helix-turn-helix domain-containing protein [Mesorhizobium sp. YC-2]MCV3230161.1 helix-turn-helix domain-containing protein [Mesorhizobium sp. YC-39]
MEKLLTFLDEERGRRIALAAHLGISPSAISMWTRVPTDHLGKIEDFTGIPRDQLRPDIFGVAA